MSFIYQNEKNLHVPGIYHFQDSDMTFSTETNGSHRYFYLFPFFWGTVKITYTVTDLEVSLVISLDMTPALRATIAAGRIHNRTNHWQLVSGQIPWNLIWPLI